MQFSHVKSIRTSFTNKTNRFNSRVEWGTWTRLQWEIFYSHILRPILRKSAIVIFKKQIKTFDSNNFTMPPTCMSLKRKAAYTVLVQNQNYARAKSGVRSCCAARTCKPPQEVKVPYFCGPFVVYPQELWNERSQKSSRQEARKLPQASRRRMKFFISVNLKEVCSVCRLFVTTPFCSVDTNSLCGSKR